MHTLRNLQPWQQGGRGMCLTKWRTIGNQLYTVTDECFKSYVQGVNKLTCLFLTHYKMESIYIQNLMKGQGSLELAMEIMKKERKKIDN